MCWRLRIYETLAVDSGAVHLDYLRILLAYHEISILVGRLLHICKYFQEIEQWAKKITLFVFILSESLSLTLRPCKLQKRNSSAVVAD